MQERATNPPKRRISLSLRPDRGEAGVRGLARDGEQDARRDGWARATAAVASCAAVAVATSTTVAASTAGGMVTIALAIAAAVATVATVATGSTDLTADASAAARAADASALLAARLDLEGGDDKGVLLHRIGIHTGGDGHRLAARLLVRWQAKHEAIDAAGADGEAQRAAGRERVEPRDVHAEGALAVDGVARGRESVVDGLAVHELPLGGRGRWSVEGLGVLLAEGDGGLDKAIILLLVVFVRICVACSFGWSDGGREKGMYMRCWALIRAAIAPAVAFWCRIARAACLSTSGLASVERIHVTNEARCEAADASE